ncbi:MAG: hypothetical protein HY927_11330 [Elusimicrobia bacterium]|nr:hypothetical protein [Elusimicrobiota bacterium]
MRAAVVSAFVAGGWCAAEERALSRQMRLGIMYYEQGEDGQAMDRFMDVLTRGDASERPLANEYINLITQRMNAGGVVPPASASAQAKPLPVPEAPPEPGQAVTAPKASASKPKEPDGVLPPPAKPPKAQALEPAGPEVVVEPEAPAMVTPTAKPAKVRRPVPVEEEEEAAPASVKPSREAMEKEIRAKIRAVFDKNFKKIRELEELEVLAADNGDPIAIGVPTAFLFQAGISFKKNASALLDALTGVVYSLKNAQLLILPEGTAVGDPKILDMRRTMGISSHFYAAGISPARVRVNLLTTQVDIPAKLRNFKGILLLFVYNRPLDLVMEGEAAHDAGPTLSLGIYPDSFSVDRPEGAVIEFSVLEPPVGLASWRFQLLRPSSEEGENLQPLNHVVGSGPVFHQIYWNGRKNYFGSALPAGRYECVLTATDAKNRQRTMHRWITLAGSAPEKAAEGEAAPAVKLAAGPPPADLPPAADKARANPAESLVKPQARRHGRRTRKVPAKKPAAAGAGDAGPGADGAGETGAAQGRPEAAGQQPAAPATASQQPAAAGGGAPGAP